MSPLCDPSKRRDLLRLYDTFVPLLSGPELLLVPENVPV